MLWLTSNVWYSLISDILQTCGQSYYTQCKGILNENDLSNKNIQWDSKAIKKTRINKLYTSQKPKISTLFSGRVSPVQLPLSTIDLLPLLFYEWSLLFFFCSNSLVFRHLPFCCFRLFAFCLFDCFALIYFAYKMCYCLWGFSFMKRNKNTQAYVGKRKRMSLLSQKGKKRSVSVKLCDCDCEKWRCFANTHTQRITPLIIVARW